jgi:hypothetical protein
MVLSYCHGNIAWDSSKSLSLSCSIADAVCGCPPFTDDSHTGLWTEIKNTTDVGWILTTVIEQMKGCKEKQ